MQDLSLQMLLILKKNGVVGYTRKSKVYLMIFEENSEGLFFSKPLKSIS